MNQPCYRTYADFVAANSQKQKIVKLLTDCRHAILILGAEMPFYWNDSTIDIKKIELVREIEDLIGEMTNENS